MEGCTFPEGHEGWCWLGADAPLSLCKIPSRPPPIPAAKAASPAARWPMRGSQQPRGSPILNRSRGRNEWLAKAAPARPPPIPAAKAASPAAVGRKGWSLPGCKSHSCWWAHEPRSPRAGGAGAPIARRKGSLKPIDPGGGPWPEAAVHTCRPASSLALPALRPGWNRSPSDGQEHTTPFAASCRPNHPCKPHRAHSSLVTRGI